MNALALQTEDLATALSETTLVTTRKSLYLKAIQSERIQALVGPQQQSFQVSRDLLVKCSPVFNTMCNSSFKESVDGFIKLPEVEVPAFEDFMLWLHSYIPSQVIEKQLPAALDLAIFADTYKILPLQNQTSNIILQLLLDDRSLVTPEIISRVYESLPDGSVIRRHFCLAFCTLHDPATRYPFSPPETSPEWEAVFDAFSNFGRDHFKNTRSSPASEFQRKDFCSFHDHSNMIGWVRGDRAIPCPYQEGDWLENEVIMYKLLEEEKQRKKKQREVAQAVRRKMMRDADYRAAAAAAFESSVKETDNHIPAEEAPPEDVPEAPAT